MPIVIDEVVISVDVSNQASGGGGPQPDATESRQQIVAECVERVLEILEQRQER
jgi:hypothetical protein